MNKIVRAQYYVNEVCNVVQLIAALVASFIADVISFLAAARRCMLHVACFIAVVIGVLPTIPKIIKIR